MLEELKRKSLKDRIVTILILIAVSVGLLFATDFGALKAVQGCKPLEDLSVDELNGQYVNTEVYFIYDWYAGTQSVNKSTNKKTITEKEYIIPIGENEFMGLLVEKKYLDQAEDLMKDSQKILEGKTQEFGESFYVKGTIMPMNEKSLGYYHDVIGYDEYEPEEQELFLPLVLKADYLGRTNQGLTWLLTAVALLSLIGALWMLIGSLTGWFQKDIRVFCQASGSPETTMEQLEAFYHNTEPTNGIRMGQFLMFEHGGRDTVVNSSDIVWAYLRTVQHRTNGIPTGKTYGVLLRTRNPKKSYEISMKNEDAARDTLNALHSVYPQMVLGYTPELEKLYNTNMTAFTQLTSAPAQETQPQS